MGSARQAGQIGSNGMKRSIMWIMRVYLHVDRGRPGGK